MFDGEGRFVTAVLRPAKRPSGKEIKPFLRRLLRAIRAHWPNTEILLRADSHYCGREVLDWCRANGLDYILGIAPTTTLRRHVEGLEASTKARFEAAPRDGKLRRFMEFFDGAQSWSRVERIIARVEAGAEGPDTRFVVTNLSKRDARGLYEDVYCPRGQAENHIKSWKTHLAADRTSCSRATANQFRLFLHAGAYWLMWGLRVSMPKRSMWRVAQFDTLRLRLIKIAARVVEMKTIIRYTCRAHAPLRISCASLWDAYRASSHDRRGMRPQTFTHVPSTRKPFPSNSGSRPEPTSRGQTYAKFKKITQTQPSRARTCQRAALSGLGSPPCAKFRLRRLELHPPNSLMTSSLGRRLSSPDMVAR